MPKTKSITAEKEESRFDSDAIGEKADQATDQVDLVSIDGPGIKCDAVEVGSRAAAQLAYYAAQPKVRTRIPRGPGEKPGAFETVIVNDLRINILKGETVNLPEDVSKIIEDAFYQTDKALNETKIAPAFGGGVPRPLRVDMQSDSDKAALGA